MEMLAVKPHACFFNLNPKIVTKKQIADVFIQCPHSRRKCFCVNMGYERQKLPGRTSNKCLFTVATASSGVQDVEVSSPFKEFTITTSSVDKTNELKISVEVSGLKTQQIFDNVFSKMVADAQPIPGFRRVKGGKTPNIPREILLEILGPSKVYKQVIEKVINSTIAEYVDKEGLTVSKDLLVEQSFEDLEEIFEPGDEFRFDAIVQFIDSN
ncbi:trigger factor [Olea europaea subsp. europaea]|uniref:peptidylprolyl isomerase n=1 Tax=Olea europaea subsp. europaea TaxID=158383 RepID=A0A8S0S635_OLEEU|nr:trigger factor [Olea europaea subsp. europaea]